MGSYTTAQGFEGGEMAQRVVQLLPNKPGSLGECRERDWEDVGLTSVNGERVSERGRERDRERRERESEREEALCQCGRRESETRRGASPRDGGGSRGESLATRINTFVPAGPLPRRLAGRLLVLSTSTETRERQRDSTLLFFITYGPVGRVIKGCSIAS
jgi:hypothetical protein